ncbi:DUF5134 domain-containing protein [Nocardia cyriacigeorgica]|uniref:DUF5134 domain-containing protein n=1 Tax=Nocardia cyriacigeorgica (strain GUH-2) TaxID=1127134 RepID=H6R356_NOCCG|nr:DUF5134 domain-containing protein [Nocardia cyriacigeorgica]MBF6284757.1 DUF5134 domain-containing protein [Nocardia cyriacigeorgica]MBF6423710.1 DUF5134 domain-containing protein [Nocardia cyriacigeorgica]CCF64455.1 membrane protein of unknown function [Nocardia cyriacigeorgica GUH-2]
MAEFVLEYAALRWMVVGAFVIAAAVVVARVTVPLPVPTGAVAPAAVPNPAHHRESDAAHLIMCMVMLAMLVFPVHAHGPAMRGLLIAMTVAFAMLLLVRVVEWQAEGRALPVARVGALGYHVAAAAVMLYAMSGHAGSGHDGGPAPGPVIALAVLFLVDAAVLLGCVVTGRTPRWLDHAGARPVALLPHLVMDLGTAYMLIAAVAN